MKKALEAALVVAALGVAATVVFQWRARRAAGEAARAASLPAAYPGLDVDPALPPSAVSTRLPASERGVDSLPAVKMSAAPKSSRRESAVPPTPGP